MVSSRIKKNLFPNAFYTLQIFSFNPRPKFLLFLNIVFLKLKKTDFFCKIFQKTFISASQTVDNTENEKNNEKKLPVYPRTLYHRYKTIFSDNPHKNVWNSMKLSKKSRFLYMFKALNFCRKVERRENAKFVKEPGH